MLENKTIFITGSSRGIGEATARLARAYGAKVILHGKEESKVLERLSKELHAEYEVFDLADEKAVEVKVAKLKEVDILVNNAGVNPSKNFMDLSTNDWRNIFDVNVLGLVCVSKALLPAMMKRKSGKIINIASIKGLNTTSGKPGYASSKAAVIRITSSMAEEFAPYNICVNAVAPGFVNTDMTTASLSPQIRAQIKKIPLQRLGGAEEIAEMVLYLGSHKADYITGQTFVVDGGYSIAG